jgi:hypothetical protein
MMNSMFGDVRLDKRLERLTEQLSIIPMVRLPQALTDWSSLKAGYRFVNNESVTHAGIIELERQATGQRAAAAGGDVILAVQDTTTFNFANRAALSGLGVLDDNKTPGFFAHTTLAVSEQGVPLGILAQQVWSRAPKRKGNLCRLPSSSRGKRLVKQPTGSHGAVHSKQEFDVKSSRLAEARRQKKME